ncbi:CLOCK-interacting pacemaker [Thalassophryne amazonica]|uniref:CLOCK-interacting pacemaker n=1 Tax=Thalassophryne amazonica TaxID=390379 RepID=UPI0014721704|nr:CLOCK-interacting pacemaker [Thalassophryne amazonica]XP_034018301.1 CLOCK-interacting pacemaker [Thalassophryne amazonica]
MSTKRKAECHLRAVNGVYMTKTGDHWVDSERDSGFSDESSEYMSTVDAADAENSPRSVAQQRPHHSGSEPQSCPVAMVGGSYTGLSPMIIMNNVVLKQHGESPPALKPWGFSPRMEVVQKPQVVFLQHVVSPHASPAPKDASSRHRHSKKYLPILKSYPKIAPHPRNTSSLSGRGTDSTSSSGSETGTHQEYYHPEKQQRVNSGSSTPSVPVPPSSNSPRLQNRLSVSSRETSSSSGKENQSEFTSSSSFSLSKYTSGSTANQANCVSRASSPGVCSHGDSEADTRRKRFCNTYNILSKSGLLDITLQTKELLRQNRRSQNDLDRLKEHTELFFQALQSGDASMCVKLQDSLQEENEERGARL